MAQILAIKAQKKREYLLEKVARQEALYRMRIHNGDREGAAKALKNRNELLRKARYATFRLSRHS